MGTTSDKLTYLNTTKGKIKDVINMTGANITSDTTFRNYATKLYDGYVNVLKDKNTLLDNMPKGTSTSYITDAANLPVYEDKMSKESTQDGTPTPENPVEVKTVKGYRNLFDKDNLTYKEYTVRDDNGNEVSAGASAYTTSFVSVKPNTKYTISGALFRLNDQSTFRVYYLDSNKNWISRTESLRQNPYTFVTPQNCYYIQFQYIMDVFTGNDVQITESTEELPYVPYGTNWIYTAVSNGTDTNYYTIPLNGNEIAGIGNYKDELIVDKNGKCWLNKKIGKYVISGNENMEYKGTSNDLYAYSIPNFENYENNVSSLSNYFKTYNTYGWSNALNRGISICLLNYGTSTNRIIYIVTDKTTINDLKQWLQDKYNNNTPVILYYVLATPQLIDLNYTVDLTLFEGINNISNSEDMDMEIKYIKEAYE